MKEWLLGIVYASLISSAAQVICPDGRVKNVMKLCCGLLCALALAGPLLKLDGEQLSVGLAVYEQAARAAVEGAQEEAKTVERAYIEEACAAYILGKATETGAGVSGVSVTAKWDGENGVWYPWTVTLSGVFHEGLSRQIEADLGMPVQRQIWEEQNHE